MKDINVKFRLLQAIGIILVVLGHKGGIYLFTDWFPIYSFHMPLFIFISGYFYKSDSDKDILDFVSKKIKTLLIPYFTWNLVYGIIVTILKSNNIVTFGKKITLKSLFIDPWVTGDQFGLNVAGWFVLALFLVHLTYVVLRKLFKFIRFNNEYVIMIFFMIIGILAVIECNKGVSGWRLTIFRNMFLIPFYHMGYLYNKKIENRYTIPNWAYFLGLFAIQFLLLKKYSLNFSAVYCSNFNKKNILLPYISSLTGIMFWLGISKLLIDIVKPNKLIDRIGSNTWTIMMHHQLVFFTINLILSLVKNLLDLQGFNTALFKRDIWYGYNAGNNRFLLFYVIAGIAVPIIVKHYVEKIKVSCKLVLEKL